MENNKIPSTLVLQNSPSPPSPPPISKQRKGGWRSIQYILANETFDKLATFSLIANITMYLRTEYNMDGIHLVSVVSIWVGSSNLTPIPGALISDTYLGRFRTLLYGSIASVLGMGIMTLTAAIPELRPIACQGDHCPEAEGWQLGILFSGLALLAIGAGGIRPCNVAFGADQFDTRTPMGKAQLESFFNWWYLSFSLSQIVALTAIVYIQTNISWTLGLAIATGCLLLSIAILLSGYHTYIIKKPEGSVFVDMAKVITASFRKRKVTLESEHENIFYNPPLLETETETQTGRLPHKYKFRCLDKAAVIVDSSELDNLGKAKDGWRLCSLLQVERLKMLVGVIPVWVTGTFCFLAMDQHHTVGILQAIQTNKMIGNFRLPPGWAGLIQMFSLSAWILLYEPVYLPLSRKMTGKIRRLTIRQRITTGIIMAILSLFLSGFVERQRRLSALQHGSFESPLSVLLLIPQFSLSGLTEAFAIVALLEFLTTQLPESMRTVSGAIFCLSISVSNYLNSVLAIIIHGLTTKYAKAPWLGGTDLNKDNLEYFYFFIAGLEVLNLLYFVFFAYRYVSNDVICKKESEDQKKMLKEESACC